jgi:hypothetical protein
MGIAFSHAAALSAITLAAFAPAVARSDDRARLVDIGEGREVYLECSGQDCRRPCSGQQRRRLGASEALAPADPDSGHQIHVKRRLLVRATNREVVDAVRGGVARLEP